MASRHDFPQVFFSNKTSVKECRCPHHYITLDLIEEQKSLLLSIDFSLGAEIKVKEG